MGVRIGAIGLGGLGFVELDVLAELPDVEIVAGADVASEARDVFEAEFDAPAADDHEAMLDAHAADLDAALVTTPHALHYEHASACLARGLDVFVEKPMVTDVGDAVDLVETAREGGYVLQVGYQRHFHPGFEEVKWLLDQGRIGELHTVSCHLAQNWVDPHRGTWRLDPGLSGGGQLYDSGSHLLDVLLWATGGEPSSVAARIEFLEPGVDVDSALAVTLTGGERPVTASVTVSGDGIALDPSEGYFLWGTDGRVTYYDGQLTVARRGGVTYAAEVDEGTDFRTLTREKLRNFVDAVEGEASPVVPGAYAVRVTALTEAAYRAVETGEVVDVQALVEEARAGRGGD